MKLRRLFHPQGMKVRLHPLFLLLVVTSLLSGLIVETAVSFAIVIVHELGHVFVARAYGYRVREMVVLPFGGVAKLEHGAMGWNPRHEVAIAIAGPLNNLLMIVVAVGLQALGWWSEALTEFFIKGNLLIGFFNLLPALPLDGGRILRAATSRKEGFWAATEVSIRVSLGIATVLVVVGLLSLWVGALNVTYLTLGGFLLLSAWELRKGMKADLVRFLDAKRREKRKDVLPVRSLAVPGTMRLRQVIERFAPDRYHLIYVLDEKKNVLAVLGEEEVVRHVFEENGWQTSLLQVAETGVKKRNLW
jgi:stage IV sporulation protein FB